MALRGEPRGQAQPVWFRKLGDIHEGQAVDVSTWALTVSHSILLEKLAAHGWTSVLFVG